jgi:hypothetical protein
LKANKYALFAGALAAATFVLTGCEPASTAGGAGGSGSGGITCDPNGFGPLSGCDSAGEPAKATQGPAETTTKPAATTLAPATLAPARIDPTPCAANRSWNDCVAVSQSSDNGFTLTVTWIVVSIDFTGFQECVIGLRVAPAKPDDQFSHRLTTVKDCEGQRVDTVYRPVAG